VSIPLYLCRYSGLIPRSYSAIVVSAVLLGVTLLAVLMLPRRSVETNGLPPTLELVDSVSDAVLADNALEMDAPSLDDNSTESAACDTRLLQCAPKTAAPTTHPRSFDSADSDSDSDAEMEQVEIMLGGRDPDTDGRASRSASTDSDSDANVGYVNVHPSDALELDASAPLSDVSMLDSPDPDLAGVLADGCAVGADKLITSQVNVDVLRCLPFAVEESPSADGVAEPGCEVLEDASQTSIADNLPADSSSTENVSVPPGYLATEQQEGPADLEADEKARSCQVSGAAAIVAMGSQAASEPPSKPVSEIDESSSPRLPSTQTRPRTKNWADMVDEDLSLKPKPGLEAESGKHPMKAPSREIADAGALVVNSPQAASDHAIAPDESSSPGSPSTLTRPPRTPSPDGANAPRVTPRGNGAPAAQAPKQAASRPTPTSSSESKPRPQRSAPGFGAAVQAIQETVVDRRPPPPERPHPKPVYHDPNFPRRSSSLSSESSADASSWPPTSSYGPSSELQVPQEYPNHREMTNTQNNAESPKWDRGQSTDVMGPHPAAGMKSDIQKTKDRKDFL
jgi:hypothetical protein